MAKGTTVRKPGKAIIRCAIELILLTLMVSADPGIPEFTKDGFRVPQPDAQLEFPRDHASHPDFRIEWWYLTGHLYTTTGERFGYQATFFRNAAQPGIGHGERLFNNTQHHLTHVALTDVSGKAFHFEQRFSREGWDAFARTDKLEVQNGNWSLLGNADVSVLNLRTSIKSDAELSLKLIPQKQLVRFGRDGTSRKGPLPESRSYYLTFSRMLTEGVLTIGDRRLEVSGLSWMDHEIASNQLDPNYTGWDWIAIHLNDGLEVKAYLLREENGASSPFSQLIWINPEGKIYYCGADDFEWVKSALWRSSFSNASYPNAPIIKTRHPVTQLPMEFHFKPVLDDQELVLPNTTYWEGAGKIIDGDGNEAGAAYLELVGYAGRIRGL
jgi:predicted secreted hydrolase